MAIIDGLTERELVLDDIPGGLALSEEAGWNQTARDWQLMLTHGRGFGFESRAGQLVATALTLPHGDRLAWISMVLVTATCRKRGLATHLLQTCIDSLSSRSLVPLLDATEAGRIVYSKIGFRPLYGLQRMVRDEPVPMNDHPPSTLRPMLESDLWAVLQLDRSVFGADRSAVLTHLFERQRDRALMAVDETGVAGYIMARDGGHAFHIGPIVAPSVDAAIGMTARLLDDVPGPVYIDTMNCREAFQAWLRTVGFVTQRPFTRMVLGKPGSFDQTDRIFAAVGPELG